MPLLLTTDTSTFAYALHVAALSQVYPQLEAQLGLGEAVRVLHGCSEAVVTAQATPSGGCRRCDSNAECDRSADDGVPVHCVGASSHAIVGWNDAFGVFKGTVLTAITGEP